MDQSTKVTLDALDFIKERMATKDVLRQFASKDDVHMIVREELREVRSDVKAIRSEFDELRDTVDNIAGYRKEIDHALERIGRDRKNTSGSTRKSWREALLRKRHVQHLVH
jgi:hypothetical protein